MIEPNTTPNGDDLNFMVDFIYEGGHKSLLECDTLYEQVLYLSDFSLARTGIKHLLSKRRSELANIPAITRKDFKC